MNISILTTSFPRYPGDSAGTFVRHFARGLLACGCRVNVIAPHDIQVQPGPGEENLKVIWFRYVFPCQWQSLAYGAGMLSRIRKNIFRLLQIPSFLISFFLSASRLSDKSDILQTFWSVGALVGIAVKWIKNIPIVVRLSGADALLIRTPIIRILFRVLINQADRIVCQSEQFMDQLTQAGIGRDKIVIIRNGIDLDRFYPADHLQARKTLSLPQDRTLLLTVARLSPSKGQSCLIQAVSEVLKVHPSVDLILVGDGETRETVTSLIEELGMKDHVRITGFQDENTIPIWLNSADIFVLPSLSDGSPNILLEAMACGLPIVASSVGGIPEMIQHGENGLLVPPGSPEALSSSICELIGNPARRTQLAENARERLHKRHGTWKAQSDALVSLYREIISKRK